MYNLAVTDSIFIVEDNENQRDFLSALFSDAGYSVRTVGSGSEALKMLDKVKPDLVILDLGLPDITGETVFQEIRKNYPELPVVIVTARGKVSDIVEGFNLGADDYVTKPYNADDLLVRVRARLKHVTSSKLVVSDLEIDTEAIEVKRAGKKIDITPKEFKLLEYLMLNQGRVLTREMILNRVWLYSPDMETRAVDVYIGYLRKKIDNGHKAKLIQSVRGYGYMIKG